MEKPGAARASVRAACSSSADATSAPAPPKARGHRRQVGAAEPDAQLRQPGLPLLELDQRQALRPAARPGSRAGPGRAACRARPGPSPGRRRRARPRPSRPGSAGWAPMASGRAAPMVQKPADCSTSSGRRARHIWLNRMRCAPLSTVRVASGGSVAASSRNTACGPQPAGPANRAASSARAAPGSPSGQKPRGGRSAKIASSSGADRAEQAPVDAVHAVIGRSRGQLDHAGRRPGTAPASPAASRSDRSRRAGPGPRGRAGPAGCGRPRATGRRRPAPPGAVSSTTPFAL